MPGISGIDLAMTMRAQFPKCKILLFSGHPATLDLLEEARAQGHDFHLLLKPVPPAELLLEIGKLVDAPVPIPPRSTTIDPCTVASSDGASERRNGHKKNG